MNNILVTMKSNVEVDESGLVVRDEDGEIILKDEDDVGVLAKTHVIPLSQVDKEGNILPGFVSRCEIFWDLRRCPAPDMVDPSDLIWLEIVGEDDDDDPPPGEEEDLEPEYEEAV